MLERLGARAAGLARRSPWTDVYGLARTLLALGTLATLVASDVDALFHPAVGAPPAPQCTGSPALSLYCVTGPDRLELARWLGVFIVAITATGWRPRWTALPHWWVAWSTYSSLTVTDGGDQVTAVLTLLLLPVALTDTRRWHWDRAAGDAETAAPSEQRRRVVAGIALWLVRLQVAGIYLHAAVAKLGQTEWADGTALYYWLGNPTFGLPPWVRWATDPVLRTGVGVAALTWGVLVFELALVLGLVAAPRWRRPLLLAGVLFHLGIAGMGLASFTVAMWAALVLYLRPPEEPFALAGRLGALIDGAGPRAWRPPAAARRFWASHGTGV